MFYNNYNRVTLIFYLHFALALNIYFMFGTKQCQTTFYVTTHVCYT